MLILETSGRSQFLFLNLFSQIFNYAVMTVILLLIMTYLRKNVIPANKLWV